MTAQPVNFTISEGIGHLELNRPQAANTINMPLAESLRDAAQAAATDDTVAVVVLSAAGKRFCAGGDIAAIKDTEHSGNFLTELATTADAGVQRLENLNRPVVAAVHGAVAGAGLGIMLAADIIVADPETKFVFAYPEIGLTPDCGASIAIPRAIGLQRALAFALSGAPLSANEALSQGLITEISEDPQTRANEIATAWVTKAPGALGATRQLLRRSNTSARAVQGARESETIGQRVILPESQALIDKFLSR